MDWYRFELHGNTEVTIFVLDRGPARTGARGTRFFKSKVVGLPDAKAVVERAAELMANWPPGTWPRPAGIQQHEHAIVLAALQQAMGSPPGKPGNWNK
jgi:hypothetical protein